MVDVTVKVLEPATSIDLLTLAEAKLLLGMSPDDTSKDELLTMQISIYSATVAEMCNRTFAKEKVEETWRELFNGRVFLTHWPVKETDIESVVSAGNPSYPNFGVMRYRRRVSTVNGEPVFEEVETPVSVGYELEEQSGKLSNVALYASESSAWPQAVTVTYTGGFDLPTEAPLPLKQATALLIQEANIKSRQAETAGIRQITHKDSRVVFFDPNAVLIKTVGAKSQGMQAIESLLKQYTRFWV